MKKIFICLGLSLILSLGAVPAFAEGHLVVLMYHRFDAGGSISTPMNDFKRQMNYLQEENYNFVTLDDVTRHLSQDKPFPDQSVLITIDDGYESTYTKAYPFLKQKGIPWVFYPYTQAINNGYSSFVTWDMVEEMSRNGADVENHSYSHEKFIHQDLDGAWVTRELTNPHETLRSVTERESRSFAIPYGMYDQKLIRILQQRTDYDVVFHIDPGVVDPEHHDVMLPRFGINRHTTWDEFKNKLNRLHLPVRDTDPAPGTRLNQTPDTVSVTLENPDRVREGPINVFVSEFNGALEWEWAEDGRTIVAELPGQATQDWNRVIVTAYDKKRGKYRYYSHGLVFD